LLESQPLYIVHPHIYALGRIHGILFHGILSEQLSVAKGEG